MANKSLIARFKEIRQQTETEEAAAILVLAEALQGSPARLDAPLSITETAKILGVSPSGVRRLVQSGRLPGQRLADKGAIKIRPDALSKFMAESTAAGQDAPPGQVSIESIRRLKKGKNRDC